MSVQDLLVQVTGAAFCPTGGSNQVVEVSANNERLGAWSVKPDLWLTYSVVVPARLFEPGGNIELDLFIPDAEVPGGPDPRLLGIAVQSLRLSH